MDAFRSMLDELMGKDRDLPPDQRRGVRLHDKDVCKHALCGLCPYELFHNTKSDLGACEYSIHEDHIAWEGLQAEWNALSEREKDKYSYERQLHRLLKRLISDMDRYIDKQQERARIENAPKPLTPDQIKELDDFKAQAKASMELSEKAAEAGDVDASMKAAQHAERLQAEAQKLHKRYTDPDRRIRVCDVCGVFIQTTDNDQRLTDHFAGKQYKGWKAIRDKYAELEAKISSSSARDRDRERDRSGGSAYPVSSGRDRDRDRHDSGEYRDRDRGSKRDSGPRYRDRRDYRDKERRRERSRSRSRSRDRRRRYDDDSSDKYRRSRHSSRDYRDRERDREGSGGREPHERERDSPKQERSKSPEEPGAIVE